MRYELRELPYNREKAVEYAHTWAYFRNPNFYNFDEIGGDCTNYASQCLFAGSNVMNYTPTFGWYYININERAPAWTGVQYLYNFLTANKGAGPFGREVAIEEVQPGDLVQLVFEGEVFAHSPIIVSIDGEAPALHNINVAAHTTDCDCRPVSSYIFKQIRFIHIDGVRYPQAIPD